MQRNDDTSFREIADTLLRAKWIILIVTCAAVLGSVAAAWLVPEEFRAAVVLSPVSNSSNSSDLGSLGAVASQLAGIASLAGVSVRTDNFRSETLATLQSDILARRFIDEQHLLPTFLPKGWHPEVPYGSADSYRQLSNLEFAAQRFKKATDVSENSRTGLVTFSVTWTDPALASQWANDVVKMTNDYIRDKAIRRSENNIAYLSQQAAETDIAGVRTAIYSILESELKTAMLARGTEEYALTVIDPAVPPTRPWSPRKLVWIVIGALSGFFGSVFIVLLRKAWIRARED